MLYNKRKRIINEDENVINPSADKEYTLFSSPGTYINDTDDINGEESLFEPFYDYLDKTKEKIYKKGHLQFNNVDKDDFVQQGPIGTYIKIDFTGQERYFPITTAKALKVKIDTYLNDNNFQINTFRAESPEKKELIGIYDIYDYFNEGNMNKWIIVKTASDTFFKDNETYKGIGEATHNLGNLLEYFFGKMPDNQSLADFNMGDLKTYRFDGSSIELFSQTPENGVVLKDNFGNIIKDEKIIKKVKVYLTNSLKNDSDGQVTRNISSANHDETSKVNYSVANKTFASVLFDKDKNGTSHPTKIILKTYFNGIKGIYLETVYDAPEINKKLQNNIPKEFNKFTKTIKDKISGLLQVDSIRMHLSKPIKIPGIKYNVASFIGFPRCHIHTMLNDGVITTNFINAINNGNITIDFTLKKSNVSAKFIIKNEFNSWHSLYDVNISTKIIPGETSIKTIDTTQNNNDIPENIMIQKLNENTLNLIVRTAIKNLLHEAKLNEKFDWDESGKCIKIRYDGPDGDEIYDFPAGNIDPKTGKFLDIIAADKAGLIKDPQEMEEYKTALRQSSNPLPKPVNTSTSSKPPKMSKEEYNKFYPNDYAKAMHSMYIDYIKLSKKEKSGGLSDKEGLTLADLQHSLSKDNWFYREKQIRKERMSL